MDSTFRRKIIYTARLMQMASFQRAMNRRPGNEIYENIDYIHKDKNRDLRKYIHCLVYRISTRIPGSENNCFRGDGTFAGLHHWLFVGWMHLNNRVQNAKRRTMPCKHYVGMQKSAFSS